VLCFPQRDLSLNVVPLLCDTISLSQYLWVRPRSSLYNWGTIRSGRLGPDSQILDYPEKLAKSKRSSLFRSAVIEEVNFFIAFDTSTAQSRWWSCWAGQSSPGHPFLERKTLELKRLRGDILPNAKFDFVPSRAVSYKLCFSAFLAGCEPRKFSYSIFYLAPASPLVFAEFRTNL